MNLLLDIFHNSARQSGCNCLCGVTGNRDIKMGNSTFCPILKKRISYALLTSLILYMYNDVGDILLNSAILVSELSVNLVFV